MTTKIEITADAMTWQDAITELSWMQDPEGQVTAEKFTEIDEIYSAAWMAQYGENPVLDEYPDTYLDAPKLTIALDEDVAALIVNIIADMGEDFGPE